MRIDNVDMRIVFEGTPPRRSWWCVWDDYAGGELVRRLPLDVGTGGELHQFIPFLEQAVVGFQWDW
ncbi:hypothetical protein ACIBEA_42025 [Streptomyces sp. NPDC051555]|uniref:hypothetical protein n=1 Tax=Streptomyces sp. NPDC051555 TaxID=3365657 RepID=UPI0037B4D214